MTSGSDSLPALDEQSDHRRLPHRLRLLCVGPEEPPWALLALRFESAGCHEAEFDWQSRSSEALARLRTTSFDCIVLADAAEAASGRGSALSIVEALRSSGSDDPVAVLLQRPDDDRMLQYDAFECEVLVSAHGWQSRALASAIRRAITRSDTRRNVSSLEQAAHRGRARERDEAEAQLLQLRNLVSHQLDGSEHAPPGVPSHVTSHVTGYYRELLRTYVMMGSGNLREELKQLAELLSLSGTSPDQALAIHLDQVECLVNGLGNRSSRHVMARADLLALELLIYLGECYRQKPQVRGIGDAGVDLLHAESLLQRIEDQAD